MRIISKFRDYYDCGQRMGVDRELVFFRETKDGDIISLPACDVLMHKDYIVYNGPFCVRSILCTPIVFCGALYWRWQASVHSASAAVVEFACSEEALKQLLYVKYGLLKQNTKSHWHSERIKTFKEKAENFNWQEQHLRHHSPVLSFRYLTTEENKHRAPMRDYSQGEYRIVVNPSLLECGFFQEKDPFQAYQEISMYLGGVLGSEGNDMVQLTDSEVHQKHGFDKWSFRRMPQKRK